MLWIVGDLMYSKTANPNTSSCVGFAPTIKGIIKMRDWLYFYIEFTVQRGEIFKKESGWALGLQKFEKPLPHRFKTART